MAIYSYKLTVDSGFAPNPFWGALTLATCKPRLRDKRSEGEWIAGWTSNTLCGDKVGEERLVYLMQITEKTSFADYFMDKRFLSKIPDQSSGLHVNCCGDNIYKPLVADASLCSHFVQVANGNHGRDEQEYDLSSVTVLISNRFVYFGCEAIDIPDYLRPRVPLGQAPFGHRTEYPERCQEFIDFVFGLAKRSVLGRPHQWPSGDESWTTTARWAPKKMSTETRPASGKTTCNARSTSLRTSSKC